MVLPQFAHYGSPPCFEFFVNTTENHRNLVDEGWWFWSDWGFWWLFRRACLLQGWKRWGAGGFTLLALTRDLRKLVLLVNRCYGELKNKRRKTGYEGLTQKNYKLR